MEFVIEKMRNNLNYIGWNVDNNAEDQLLAAAPKIEGKLSLSYYKDWMYALTNDHMWYMSRALTSLLEFIVAHQAALHNTQPLFKRSADDAYQVELIKSISKEIDITELLFHDDTSIRELVAKALKE